VSFRRYLAVRLAWALIGLWVAATLVFGLFYVAVEDPARETCGGAQATPACLELVRNQLQRFLQSREGFRLWRRNRLGHPPDPPRDYAGALLRGRLHARREAFARDVRSEDQAEERRKRRRRSTLLFTRAVARDLRPAIRLAVFVEVIFQIPGLGRMTLAGVAAQAGDLVQAAVLCATFVAIAVHFAVDVVVAALDPGLRWERSVARSPKPA
jgi:ABC-type dipeptide/oligopeptide/nickel transport system permease component